MAIRLMLSRSHYSSLIIAGVDIDPRNLHYGLNGPGWSTPFDGGQITEPSTTVAVYAEAVEESWGGSAPVTYGVTYEGWRKEPGNGEPVKFHRRHQALESVTNPERELRTLANLIPGRLKRPSRTWEEVRDQDVPDHVRNALMKGVKTVCGNFGQGGEFFRPPVARRPARAGAKRPLVIQEESAPSPIRGMAIEEEEEV